MPQPHSRGLGSIKSVRDSWSDPSDHRKPRICLANLGTSIELYQICHDKRHLARMAGVRRRNSYNVSGPGDIDRIRCESSLCGNSVKRTSSMVSLGEAANMVRSRRTWHIRTIALSHARRAMREYVRRLRRRRPVSTASALSNHQLNDIGLVSAGFRWAARQPLHIDAHGEPARVAYERHFGRGQRTS